MSTEEFYNFLLSMFKAMLSVCVAAYVVMSSQEWPNVMTAMQKVGYHWSSTIIWAKDKFVMSRKDYHTQYEPIYYGWLEGAKHICELEDRSQSDLW